MGKYDAYAKNVLRETFGERFSTDDVVFSFGPEAGTGEVDGIIDGKVAVEIGVGGQKQVRGCVLDLMAHPLPSKLLILVDTPGHATGPSVIQGATILSRAGYSGVVYRLPAEGSGVDVYQAHLAEAVSKYIGETEKHLVRAVGAVEGTNEVLLFDEADGLFGQRDDGEAG